MWRLFTAVTFFGKLSFPFLINVYFLYSYAVQLERGIFDGQRAAMVYCVAIIWTILLLIAYLMTMPVRHPPALDSPVLLDIFRTSRLTPHVSLSQIVGVALSIAMVYVWCNVNAEAIVSFWFGMKMKAMYFPWVLTAFGILTGGKYAAQHCGGVAAQRVRDRRLTAVLHCPVSSGVMELTGIVAGHVYYFLKFKYPETSGQDFLATPNWLCVGLYRCWWPLVLFAPRNPGPLAQRLISPTCPVLPRTTRSKELFPEPGATPVSDFGAAPRARPFTGQGRRLGD